LETSSENFVHTLGKAFEEEKEKKNKALKEIAFGKGEGVRGAQVELE
jgi:hypothetical protein